MVFYNQVIFCCPGNDDNNQSLSKPYLESSYKIHEYATHIVINAMFKVKNSRRFAVNFLLNNRVMRSRAGLCLCGTFDIQIYTDWSFHAVGSLHDYEIVFCISFKHNTATFGTMAYKFRTPLDFFLFLYTVWVKINVPRIGSFVLVVGGFFWFFVCLFVCFLNNIDLTANLWNIYK